VRCWRSGEHAIVGVASTRGHKDIFEDIDLLDTRMAPQHWIYDYARPSLRRVLYGLVPRRRLRRLLSTWDADSEMCTYLGDDLRICHLVFGLHSRDSWSTLALQQPLMQFAFGLAGAKE
jgi:hypothetical protein